MNEENIIKIGHSLIWRSTFDITKRYYQENIVTACGCVFRCKVPYVTGMAPIETDPVTQKIKIINQEVWDTVLDVAETYNRVIGLGSVNADLSNKAGYFAPYHAENGVLHDRVFSSEEHYKLWVQDPQYYSDLLIADRTLPVTTQGTEHLPLEIRIDNGGDPFIAFGETKRITCRVFRGWEDVTDQVTQWGVERMTGDDPSDRVWNCDFKAKNFNGRLDIVFSDYENDLGNPKGRAGTAFIFEAHIDEQTVLNRIIL